MSLQETRTKRIQTKNQHLRTTIVFVNNLFKKLIQHLNYVFHKFS